MIAPVELDGFGEEVDGGVVVFGLEGLVSLIFELVSHGCEMSENGNELSG